MSEEIQGQPTVANHTTAQEAPAVQQHTAPIADAGSDFLSALPEDLRSDPSLGDIKDIEGLAKSYVNAQRMIGNSIRIPSEDASIEAKQEFYKRLESVPGVMKAPDFENPDERDAFFNRLGRPESPDKYNFQIPEDINADGNLVNEFASLAHQAGLTNEQANRLVAFEIERANAYNEQLADRANQAEQVLRQKWGADFDTRLDGAKSVLKQYAGDFPEAVQELVNSPVASNPAVIAMLSDLFGSLQEAGTIQSTEQTQYGTTPSEALAQIEDIMNNAAHPYHNDADVEHKAAVEKVHKLYRAAYPE